MMDRSLVRRRVFVPLAAGLVLLTLAVAGSFGWYRSQRLDQTVTTRIAAVAQTLHIQLDDDAQALAGMLLLLQNDRQLQEAYRAHDRQRLLQVAQPLFAPLRSRHRVTHFYFHDLQRRCFLRVHQPDRYGDVVDRFTLTSAATTGRPSHGIELGPLGTFTLRVVHPWKVHGQLVGYLELGEEIEHLLPRIKAMQGVELVVKLDKACLDRAKWEDTIRRLGREPRWDQFADCVLQSNTFAEIPAALDSLIPAPHHVHSGQSFRCQIAGREYRGGWLPLVEANGRDVGDLVALLDMEGDSQAVTKALAAMGGAVLLLSLGMSAVFWFYLGGVDRSLALAAQTLHERHQAAEQTAAKLRTLSRAVEQSPAAVVITDRDGNVEYVNPGFVKTTGYTAEEIAGKNPRELRSGLHPREFYQHMWQTILAGEVWRGEICNRKKDGTLFWEDATIAPVLDTDGHTTHFVAVKMDITLRKQAETGLQKAIDQLRKTTAFQQALLNSTEYSIIATDVDGTITAFNAGAERMLGYRNAEVVGRMTPQSLHDLAEIHDRARTLTAEMGVPMAPGFEVFVAKARRGLPNDQEWTYIRKDGRRIPILLSVTAVRDHTGQITGFLGIGQDIAQRKQAEEALRASEQRYRLLAENVGDVVWTAELDMRLNYISPSMRLLTGYAPEEWMTKSLAEKFTPATAEYLKSSYHLALADAMRDPAARLQTRSMEAEYRCKNGGTIWTEIKMSWILGEQGTPVGCLGITRDITARKKAAEELQEYACKLEQANHELAEATAAAQEASKAKSEFLANMSHELRTPLNGVIGMTELLRSTPLDDRQRQFVEACHSSGKSLLDLINDVLDFSKIEAGKLELEHAAFDLSSAVRDAVEAVSFLASQKNLALTCHITPAACCRVTGDRTRLRQVLVNLVGNAVKFTATGQITVGVDRVQASGRPALRFEVADTGPGIAPEQLHRLFKSFCQADSSTTRRYGGTGLGLAICKRLVELMNGEIGVDSQPGQGSTFWFTVPFELAEEMLAPPPDSPAASENLPASRNSLHGFRVLLAEDNPINQMLVREVCREIGVECRVVGNGQEAVAALGRERFDLVLMDCQMPVMDGFQATRHIRSLEDGGQLAGHVPIVALTANAIKGDRERCLAAGMDAYLSKPFEPDQLIAIMSDLLACCAQPSQIPTPPALASAPSAASDPRPPIDMQALLARCMGSLEIVDNLLADFERGLPTAVARVLEHLARGDARETAEAAHSLKGEAATMTAEPLRAAAAEIEAAAKAGNLAHAAQLADRLRRESQCTLDRCAELRPAAPSAQA
jgi:PAS domain S-box-containing protein